MTILRYSLLLTVLSLGLFAAVPALAASDDEAELWVYVQVFDNYDANDFTIEVDGNDPSPDNFKGDEDGRRVRLDEGSYEVTVRNDRGLRVYYSPGCEGRIDEDETEHCLITLRDNDYYEPYYPSYQPYYPQYQPSYPAYTAPAITIQKGYVPGLPSTGFAPLSSASVAFAVVGLLALGLLLTPYARKTLAFVLR